MTERIIRVTQKQLDKALKGVAMEESTLFFLKRVLVDGVTQLLAAEESGLSRSRVNAGVRRARELLAEATSGDGTWVRRDLELPGQLGVVINSIAEQIKQMNSKSQKEATDRLETLLVKFKQDIS